MNSAEDYFAAMRRLGLKPTKAKNVWLDLDEVPHNVPDPTGKTPEQLAEIVHQKKIALGILPPDAELN